MYIETTEKLLDFIEKSPTAFQAVDEMQKRLTENGFEVLSEKEYWKLIPGGKYLVTRNNSALIAFCIPEKESRVFHIMASHSDSPSFKIKENPEIKVDNSYVKLNVEKYGGMITQSWFDRPLGAAGRIVCDVDGILDSILVNISEPSFIIPSLAIHMTRGNDASKTGISVQKEMQPVAADKGLYELIRKEFGIKQSDILGTDLYLYNTQEGCIMGENASLISAPRIDDLQCVYSTMTGFMQTRCQDKPERDEYIKVYAAFDNEEVGSLSRQGASSDFLPVVLRELASVKDITGSGFNRMLSKSFMLSADNAHAMHPNYSEKADVVHRPDMNGGVVIKYHGGQKYTTDAFTGAFVKQICKKADIPYQTYYNNSDVAGGSTLGNLVMANLSVKAADIGIAQLAMHSSYETSGAYDTIYMSEFVKEFYGKETQI